MLIKIDVAPQIVAWLEAEAAASDAANASEVAGRIVAEAFLVAAGYDASPSSEAKVPKEPPKASKAKKAEGGDDGGG